MVIVEMITSAVNQKHGSTQRSTQAGLNIPSSTLKGSTSELKTTWAESLGAVSTTGDAERGTTEQTLTTNDQVNTIYKINTLPHITGHNAPTQDKRTRQAPSSPSIVRSTQAELHKSNNAYTVAKQAESNAENSHIGIDYSTYEVPNPREVFDDRLEATSIRQEVKYPVSKNLRTTTPEKRIPVKTEPNINADESLGSNECEYFHLYM